MPRRRFLVRTDRLAAHPLRRSLRAVGGMGAGLLLAVSLSGCFSAPPQIVALEPNRGSTSVLADAPVRVIFDKPVARASVAGRFAVVPSVPGCDLTAAFSAPSTAACWIQWLPGDTGFALIHEQAVFAPTQRYEFTLAGGFSDLAGDHNNLDHHWDLTAAAAPRVSAITPGDGTTAVAVDASLAVTFSTFMDGPTTAAAITLTPPVPGTRVVQNSTDRARFVLLPGRLLDPGAVYSISVGPSARGADNQVLASTAQLQARFTTGARLGTAHAVVLAGVPGEAPSEVLLPGLSAAAPGEPLAAPVLTTAGRCGPSAACGSVRAGGLLQTYAAATIAPDGAHVAILASAAGSGSAATLVVMDTVHNLVTASFSGAALPSWSPSGARLAFTSAGDVDVFDAVTGTVETAATSTPLVAPPLWSGASTLVLSVSGRPGAGVSATSVEIVNSVLGARYDLPNAPSGTTALAISAAGDQLALASPTETLTVVPIAAAGGAAQRLPGLLNPVGFASEGTLFAVTFATTPPQLLRVNVVGGDSTVIGFTSGAMDLATVRVDPSGRRLVMLGYDDGGALQAYVANADGTGVTPLTAFAAGQMQAQAVGFTD